MHSGRASDQTERHLVATKFDGLGRVSAGKCERTRSGLERSLNNVASDPNHFAVDGRSSVQEQLAGLFAPELDTQLLEHPD